MTKVFIIAILGLLTFPATALAPTPNPTTLQFWQASRVVRSHAKLQHRPDFRVERRVRINRRTVRVCWSEPGYLTPADGRDYGCDIVQLRGREFWLKDDAVLNGYWLRWL
jgi:hypothetical protein